MTPFHYRSFTALWIAATISYVGNFVHVMAATWLMTEITSSKLMVALIQTAGFLPFFLFTIPAGVIADRFNRRYLLLIIQSIMLLTVIAMVFLAYTHLIRPWSLLIITFILNLCAGLNSPPWQLVVADMVPRDLLPSAVTLNSVSYNIARAIGPALGGIIIGSLGLTAPFVFDAISYIGVLLVLFYWSGKSLQTIEKSEINSPSIFAGFNFVWNTPSLRYGSLQAMAFFFAASSIWTLLALIAKHTIKTDALGYGILFGCLGLGAIIAGLGLLVFRERLKNQTIMQFSIMVYAIACFGLACIHHLVTADIFCLMAGFAWLTINTSYTINIQLTAPQALKARVYSVYLMLTSGTLALGSFIFGKIADQIDSETALFIAGVLILLVWWGTSHFKSRLQGAAE